VRYVVWCSNCENKAFAHFMWCCSPAEVRQTCATMFWILFLSFLCVHSAVGLGRMEGPLAAQLEKVGVYRVRCLVCGLVVF
jgi:hypothetical protein